MENRGWPDFPHSRKNNVTPWSVEIGKNVRHLLGCQWTWNRDSRSGQILVIITMRYYCCNLLTSLQTRNIGGISNGWLRIPQIFFALNIHDTYIAYSSIFEQLLRIDLFQWLTWNKLNVLQYIHFKGWIAFVTGNVAKIARRLFTTRKYASS